MEAGAATLIGVDVMDKEMLESVHARVLARLGTLRYPDKRSGRQTRPGSKHRKEYFEMGYIEADVGHLLIVEYKGCRGCWI